MKAILLALGLTLSLSAQNILVRPPSPETPAYVWWNLFTNRFGATSWVIQGAQTTNFCKDVTVTWTTTPGKSYSVETGWLNSYGWVTLLPPTPAGTNTLMAFRTGTIAEWHLFRIREW